MEKYEVKNHALFLSLDSLFKKTIPVIKNSKGKKTGKISGSLKYV